MTLYPSHGRAGGKSFDLGYRAAIHDITAWIEKEWGTFGPDVPSGGMPCPHDRYNWEDCQECVANQLIEGIRDGSFANER